MKRVYFDSRSIVVCTPEESIPEDVVTYEAPDIDSIDVTAMVEGFRESTEPNTLILRSADADAVYRRICASFKEVNAGGGLVSRADGDCLLINRFSLWDLPKGHQEPGEDIAVTAVREVEEETGVDGLEIRSLICITDHCYIRDGIWHLKHTWWFDMYHSGSAELIPQTEEDISEAVWVHPQDIKTYMKNTFSSIREVFMKLISKNSV